MLGWFKSPFWCLNAYFWWSTVHVLHKSICFPKCLSLLHHDFAVLVFSVNLTGSARRAHAFPIQVHDVHVHDSYDACLFDCWCSLRHHTIGISKLQPLHGPCHSSSAEWQLLPCRSGLPSDTMGIQPTPCYTSTPKKICLSFPLIIHHYISNDSFIGNQGLYETS